MAESTLITTKRNFLVRALGFTAAGVALPVPIVTVADAKARLQHHIDGMKAAMRDCYPGCYIDSLEQPQELERILRGIAAPGCCLFLAKAPAAHAPSMRPIVEW